MKKSLIALAAGAVVALGSFFAFDVPVTDALAIATDKEKAKAACARLIDGEGAETATAAE